MLLLAEPRLLEPAIAKTGAAEPGANEIAGLQRRWVKPRVHAAENWTKQRSMDREDGAVQSARTTDREGENERTQLVLIAASRPRGFIHV